MRWTMPPNWWWWTMHHPWRLLFHCSSWFHSLLWVMAWCNLLGCSGRAASPSFSQMPSLGGVWMSCSASRITLRVSTWRTWAPPRYWSRTCNLQHLWIVGEVSLLARLFFWPLFDIGNHEVKFDYTCVNSESCNFGILLLHGWLFKVKLLMALFCSAFDVGMLQLRFSCNYVNLKSCTISLLLLGSVILKLLTVA